MKRESVSYGVLGGGGFVGSALVAAAEAQGLFVRAISRHDYEGARRVHFDVLFDAHGDSRRFLAERDPERSLERNVASVGRACRELSYGRYVLLSTVDVYPEPSLPSATAEDADVDGAVPSSVYGAHKRLAEREVQGAARDHLILRLGAMVGPRLAKGPVHDVLSGAPAWVADESEWPFLRTGTMARLALSLSTSLEAGRVLNLCGRGSVSFGELVRLSGRAAPPRKDLALQRYRIDTTAAARLVALPSSRDELEAFFEELRP